MKFVTCHPVGEAEFPAVLSKDEQYIIPLRTLGICADSLLHAIPLLTADVQKRIEEALPHTEGILLKELVLESPIPEPSQDVLCLGINYYAHSDEAARYSAKAFTTEHQDAIYFSKRVNRAVPDGGCIESHPNLVSKLDYECELAVVLGKDAKNVPKGRGREYIFGYTILNDISARDVQTAHKQWYFGKSLDGFTPIGPCILSANAVASYPPALDIRCWVNGELRQNSNTKLQIFDIDTVLHELTQGMTLRAGTIIATGTPAGVGMGFAPPRFLTVGDVVKCEIEGIGTLTNTVR